MVTVHAATQRVVVVVVAAPLSCLVARVLAQHVVLVIFKHKSSANVWHASPLAERCIVARIAKRLEVGGGKFNFRIKQRQRLHSTPHHSNQLASPRLYNNNNNNLLRSQRCESEEMRCNSKVRCRQMETRQQYCSIWRQPSCLAGARGGSNASRATLSRTVACMPKSVVANINIYV